MNTTDSTDTPEFSITRALGASPDDVWRAWTEEPELARWLHPFGVTTDSISFDVREGGQYRYTMTNVETGERFPTGGEFLVVRPGERLVFTWGEPGAPVESSPVITLTFQGQDAGTLLGLHLRGFTGELGDGFVYDGWDEALGNLERHLLGADPA